MAKRTITPDETGMLDRKQAPPSQLDSLFNKVGKGVTPPDKNGRCHDDHTGALASCNGGGNNKPTVGPSGTVYYPPKPKEEQQPDTSKPAETEGEKPKLTADHKTAIRHYADMDYIKMNSALRKGNLKDLSENQKIMIDLVDDSIKQSPPLKMETQVFRGIHPSILGKNPKEAEGKIFTDNGFVSTTTSERIAQGFGDAVIAIRAPKGSKALDVNDAINTVSSRREHELLFPRGTQLKIDAVIVNKKGFLGLGKDIVVRAHMIPPGQKSLSKGVTAPDKNGRCHDDHTGALASCGGSKKPFSNPSEGRSKPVTRNPNTSAPTESKEITPEEHDAVASYQGPGFKDVNNALRGKAEMNPESKKLIEHLDSAMEKHPMTKSEVTYRGIKSRKFLGQYKDAPVQELVGKVITDKGYTSTTANQTTAAQFAMGGGAQLTIDVPKGTKALDIRDLLPESDSAFEEHEILLNRGSKMKITKAEEARGTLFLRCSIIDPFLGFGEKKPPKPGLGSKTPASNSVKGPVGSFKDVSIDGNHMSKGHVEEAKKAYENLSNQYSDIIPKVVDKVMTIDNFGNDPTMSKWMLQSAAAACEYYPDEDKGCLIRLNGAYFRDDKPSKEVADWDKKDWCPRGCNTLTGVINHEFGHAVHSGIRRKVDKAIQDKYTKIMINNPISKQPNWSATAVIQGVKSTDQRILTNETFAETFAAMQSGNYNNHPAVTALKSLLNEYRKVIR